MSIDQNRPTNVSNSCFRCCVPFKAVGGARVWLGGQSSFTHHPLCYICAIKLCFMSGKVAK